MHKLDKNNRNNGQGLLSALYEKPRFVQGFHFNENLIPFFTSHSLIQIIMNEVKSMMNML